MPFYLSNSPMTKIWISEYCLVTDSAILTVPKLILNKLLVSTLLGSQYMTAGMIDFGRMKSSMHHKQILCLVSRLM